MIFWSLIYENSLTLFPTLWRNNYLYLPKHILCLFAFYSYSCRSSNYGRWLLYMSLFFSLLHFSSTSFLAITLPMLLFLSMLYVSIALATRTYIDVALFIRILFLYCSLFIAITLPLICIFSLCYCLISRLLLLYSYHHYNYILCLIASFLYW